MSGWSPAALGALARGDIENMLVAATPGGIERQEAQGQIAATKHKDRVPRFGGGWRETPEAEAELRAQAEVFGFVYGEPLDDLFVSVTFPEGWRFKPTEHSMHSDLLDEKGRKRGSMFYKAAFYDRKADWSFLPRFVLREVKDADWWEKSHPTQPEKLYTKKMVRREISEEQYELLRRDYPNTKFEFAHDFGRKIGKGKFSYDPHYDRFGDEYGYGKPRRVIYAHVEERTYLPDDQQPAAIPPRPYDVYFEFYDRMLDKVIYTSESYTVPIYFHQDIGGFNVLSEDEVGKDYWTVEESRKARAYDPIKALVDQNYPNHNDLSLWLSENPYPPRDKPCAIIPDGTDNHALTVWAKSLNVIFTSLTLGPKVYAIFPELWMKLEFDRKFGK